MDPRIIEELIDLIVEIVANQKGSWEEKKNEINKYIEEGGYDEEVNEFFLWFCDVD